MSLVKYWESPETGVVVVSLGYKDLLLESMREVARKLDIHTGVIMSGIGSLTRGHIHWVTTNEVPPGNEYLKIPGPLELVSFGGIIANYEPHVHMSLMTADGKYYGGHLEEDCEVLTLIEMSILRVPDLKITRRKRDGSRINLLDAE